MKKLWFIAGLLSALTFGAFANLPSTGDTNGSMAGSPDVSEIRAKRQADLSFDPDLKRLSSLQGRYRENLPLRDRKKPVSVSRSKKQVRKLAHPTRS
ncbi:MAG: hypothetical protein H7301_06455 [Cryobacterium sp.]|nr:hypothetical protein [Oligoflexia bacterium]